MSKQTEEQQQLPSCHEIEADVRRELLATEGVTVKSLVVRRLDNGVCLQGVIRFDGAEFDLGDTIRRIPGIDRILNHMVICNDADARDC